MTLRSSTLTFVLAFLLAATPVLSVVCHIDCDRSPASAACHESQTSGDGASMRSVHDACDRDRDTDSPALVTSISARDSVNVLAVPILPAYAFVPDPHLRVSLQLGPRGASGRSVPSSVTVLRI